MSISEDLQCIVHTKEGPICGYIDKTDGFDQYKFKSIPFALPPVGKLRFLPPQPVKPWTEVLDCTKDSPIPHYSLTELDVRGAEDCLYVEVCSPNIQPDNPLPVMFWIGGFCFTYTIDHILDAALLVEQNVVYVRCGFRTGPFGFLSINDYTAPGNCGLKDVVSALKWVQNNIAFFGGDRNNVTLFGSSSGGAIVNFMMLSPMATGLFHKAIIQSASALNNWSLNKNPSQPVIELAKELGINKSSKLEIVEELRKLSAEVIITAFLNLRKAAETGVHGYVVDSIFKPCIEVDLEGLPAFITKGPIVTIKSGNFNKVPIIIGSNNTEGALLEFVVEDFYSDYEKYNENVSLLVPRELKREDKITQTIGHKLLKFYLGGEEFLTPDTRTQYLQLISDYYFTYYVNKTVRMLKQPMNGLPIYYYVLNFAGEWTVPKKLEFMNSVGHAAELPFMFRIKAEDEFCKGSRDSISTRTRVLKLWTNFAKTGNPTPEPHDPALSITWDPITNEENLNYLSIGAELTKGINPFYERMKFWDDLQKEHSFVKTLVHFTDLGYAGCCLSNN
ncbi:unnamed protein product [Chrysodeixis includens]|uniref:Carboxylic ester hydrolase n=1 Tax=Chrysodeixis includens TaxID=689277 RepID=A0A9P0BW21_CHRIL|nr:unnamed protein product [Chrysodeixis includens]